MELRPRKEAPPSASKPPPSTPRNPRAKLKTQDGASHTVVAPSSSRRKSRRGQNSSTLTIPANAICLSSDEEHEKQPGNSRLMRKDEQAERSLLRNEALVIAETRERGKRPASERRRRKGSATGLIAPIDAQVISSGPEESGLNERPLNEAEVVTPQSRMKTGVRIRRLTTKLTSQVEKEGNGDKIVSQVVQGEAREKDIKLEAADGRDLKSMPMEADTQRSISKINSRGRNESLKGVQRRDDISRNLFKSVDNHGNIDSFHEIENEVCLAKVDAVLDISTGDTFASADRQQSEGDANMNNGVAKAVRSPLTDAQKQVVEAREGRVGDNKVDVGRTICEGDKENQIAEEGISEHLQGSTTGRERSEEGEGLSLHSEGNVGMRFESEVGAGLVKTPQKSSRKGKTAGRKRNEESSLEVAIKEAVSVETEPRDVDSYSKENSEFLKDMCSGSVLSAELLSPQKRGDSQQSKKLDQETRNNTDGLPDYTGRPETVVAGAIGSEHVEEYLKEEKVINLESIRKCSSRLKKERKADKMSDYRDVDIIEQGGGETEAGARSTGIDTIFEISETAHLESNMRKKKLGDTSTKACLGSPISLAENVEPGFERERQVGEGIVEKKQGEDMLQRKEETGCLNPERKPPSLPTRMLLDSQDNETSSDRVGETSNWERERKLVSPNRRLSDGKIVARKDFGKKQGIDLDENMPTGLSKEKSLINVEGTLQTPESQRGMLKRFFDSSDREKRIEQSKAIEGNGPLNLGENAEMVEADKCMVEALEGPLMHKCSGSKSSRELDRKESIGATPDGKAEIMHMEMQTGKEIQTQCERVKKKRKSLSASGFEKVNREDNVGGNYGGDNEEAIIGQSEMGLCGTSDKKVQKGETVAGLSEKGGKLLDVQVAEKPKNKAGEHLWIGILENGAAVSEKGMVEGEEVSCGTKHGGGEKEERLQGPISSRGKASKQVEAAYDAGSDREINSDEDVDTEEVGSEAEGTELQEKEGEQNEESSEEEDEDEEEMAKLFIKSLKARLSHASIPHLEKEEVIRKGGVEMENNITKKVAVKEDSQITSNGSRLGMGVSWSPETGLHTMKTSGCLGTGVPETIWQKEGRLQDGLLVPPLDPHKLNKLARKQAKDTAGAKWFDLPAPTITPELKKELQLLKLRRVVDPKRHYKAEDSKGLPKYFQVGTVVEGPADFYSGRLTKKERKSTLADELLSDSNLQAYRKRKYREIQDQKQAGGKKFWKQKKNRQKPSWAKT